ncbi:flagellar FliJ protein [Lachnobacterium bovis DSM 14045]|jgi:flagellar FliJ protein|uniref:Flagellar FliJ protein n=2 Tax=Lachnobacterium bovis TaxID=140626 RepID=A0A1H3EYZ2_9FIRM|nr:flagellar FliJ protein [Lachnobacterium bovis DSM 14045]
MSMAKFIYSMDNILNIKRKLENQAKIAFAQANTKYNEEDQKLKDLCLKKVEYDAILRDSLNGEKKLDLAELTKCRNNINVVKKMIQFQVIEVNNAKRIRDEQRLLLQEKIKERKTHEVLKEKAFEQFKRELMKEEAKEIDGLISYTYSNNNDK